MTSEQLARLFVERSRHYVLHLGQIIYVATLRSPGAVKFHEDAGGLAGLLWPATVEPPSR